MQNLVLVVDDESAIRNSLRMVLEDAGFGVVTANEGREGFASFAKLDPRVVIIDIIMPEQEGIETIIKMHRARPDARIIAIDEPRANGKVNFLDIAMALGANAGLTKPLDPGVLVDTVKRLAGRHLVLRWSDEMTIDGGVIDDDHRCLIAIINDFDAAKRQGGGQTATLATLSKIAAYATSHFDREEALQKLIKFPDAGEHAREHRALVSQVQALQSRLAGRESVDATIEIDLTDFLSQWLARHIMHSDLRMRLFAEELRAAERGMSPLSSSPGIAADKP